MIVLLHLASDTPGIYLDSGMACLGYAWLSIYLVCKCAIMVLWVLAVCWWGSGSDCPWGPSDQGLRCFPVGEACGVPGLFGVLVVNVLPCALFNCVN